MHELVIVIPDLYFSPPARAARPESIALPGLEHIARFGTRSRLDSGWRAWLARWAGRDDLAQAAPALIAAAALAPSSRAASGASASSTTSDTFGHTAAASGRVGTVAASTGSVWFASPLHLQAGLTTLHVDRRSLLRLTRAELEDLCADFSGVFAETGLRLAPLESGEALLFCSEVAETTTVEPARFVDADVGEALPTGPGSGFLRRLGAEIEMWLHDHPVNKARALRRDLPVSTFWLWGGGAARPSVATEAPATAHAAGGADAMAGGSGPDPAPRGTDPQPRAFGADAYLRGLWRTQGLECGTLPGSLDEALGSLSTGEACHTRIVLRARYKAGAGRNSEMATGNVVIVANVGQFWREGETFLDALKELDRRFIEPACTAVRVGTFQQLSVLANDRRVVLTARDHLRLWRRPRAGLEGLRWG